MSRPTISISRRATGSRIIWSPTQGGIILVSHDRYFLDRVTKRTVEVSRGRLTEYVGGYSRYLVQREERFALEMAAYENQRAEIEHMESFISRFRYQASKAELVQSRIKQLEKVERLEPPAGIAEAAGDFVSEMRTQRAARLRAQGRGQEVRRR